MEQRCPPLWHCRRCYRVLADGRCCVVFALVSSMKQVKTRIDTKKNRTFWIAVHVAVHFCTDWVSATVSPTDFALARFVAPFLEVPLADDGASNEDWAEHFHEQWFAISSFASSRTNVFRVRFTLCRVFKIYNVDVHHTILHQEIEQWQPAHIQCVSYLQV